MECADCNESALLESEWRLSTQGLEIGSDVLQQLHEHEAEMRALLAPGVCSIVLEAENGYNEFFVSNSGHRVSLVDPLDSALTAPSSSPANATHETWEEAKHIREFHKFICCPERSIRKFDQELILKVYLDVQARPKPEAKLALFGALAASLRLSTETHAVHQRAKRQQSDGSEPIKHRHHFQYNLFGQDMCVASLCFLFNIHHDTLKSCQKDIIEWHLFPAATHQGQHSIDNPHFRQSCVVTFLTNFASKHGLADPGKRGAKFAKPILWLPSDLHPSKVYYDHYLPSANDFANSDTHDPLAFSSFLKVWHTKLPHVKVRTPGTDICDTCTQLLLLGDQVSLDGHRKVAQAERDVYHTRVELSRLHPQNLLHLTIDFAQKLLLPLFKDQPGQLYYLTGLKLDIFGVANDTTGVQQNYFLTEGTWLEEKTAKSVLSMLHDYLFNRLPTRPPNLCLLADNQGAQNKNRFTMWYLSWLVATGRFEEIKLQFLVVGHTKSYCDSCFGLVKKSLIGEDVCCPRDAARLATKFCSANRVVTSNQVRWFDWEAFLAQFFSGTIGGVQKKQHMRFNRMHPGCVFVKDLDGSEEKMQVLFKDDMTLAHLLNPTDHQLVDFKCFPLCPKAMPPERAEYLQKNVVRRYLKGVHSYASSLLFCSE